MREKVKPLVILAIKLVMYFILGIIFFGLFRMRNLSLAHISRTLVVTVSTYLIVGFLMIMVYGNFQIGKEKSKPIIYSMTLAVLFTDIVTYLQLMVMNTNPHNNINFRIEQLDTLLLVFVLQVIVIIIFSYQGNNIYFKLYNARKTVIIGDVDDENYLKVNRFLKHYDLQYELDECLEPTDPQLLNKIRNYEYVVVLTDDVALREKIVEQCYHNNISYAFSLEIADVVDMSGEHKVFDDVPMVDVNLSGLSIEQRIAKRVLDLILSIVGSIILIPILIVVGIAIKCDDGGSIFFLQDRCTIDGKIFKVIKFRTMIENAGNFSAVEGDDRITRVGSVLRRTRLDELPQILNVLKGDMSFVGPRPEMIENVQSYEEELPEFRYRLKVKGGITGKAQIEGKYNTSPKDKLLMDLVYVENYSLWYDIKLILQTFIVVFKKDSTEGF